jgi:hypothetical protein
MKSVFKFLSVIAAIAVFTTSAIANDVHDIVGMTDSSAVFSGTHTESGNFTDTFTFDVGGPVRASATGITINPGAAQNLEFMSVDLNGQALTLDRSDNGGPETFSTPHPFAVTGPLVLSVRGMVDAGPCFNAIYTGTLNVSAVPEPGIYTLFIASLGLITVVARRRKF